MIQDNEESLFRLDIFHVSCIITRLIMWFLNTIIIIDPNLDPVNIPIKGAF